MIEYIRSKVYLGYRILKAKIARPDISYKHIKQFKYIDEALVSYLDLLEARKDISADDGLGVNVLWGDHKILIARPETSIQELKAIDGSTSLNYLTLLENRQDVSLKDFIKINEMKMIGVGSSRYIDLLNQRHDISAHDVFALHDMIKEQKKIVGSPAGNYFFLGADFDINYIRTLAQRPDISAEAIMKVKKIFQIEILNKREDISVDDVLRLKGEDSHIDIVGRTMKVVLDQHPIILLKSPELSVDQYCTEYPKNCDVLIPASPALSDEL